MTNAFEQELGRKRVVPAENGELRRQSTKLEKRIVKANATVRTVRKRKKERREQQK